MAFTLADLIHREEGEKPKEVGSPSGLGHKLLWAGLALASLWSFGNFVRTVGDSVEKFRKPKKAYLYEARAKLLGS
jgi:hypothetical protein